MASAGPTEFSVNIGSFADLYGKKPDEPREDIALEVCDESDSDSEEAETENDHPSSLNSLECFRRRITYDDTRRESVTRGFTYQMMKEVTERENAQKKVKPFIPGSHPSTWPPRKFRFDIPLSVSREPLFPGETLFLDMKVDPCSQKRLMVLIENLDFDLERGMFFEEMPDTLFLLSGKRDFALVPGLTYSFVASNDPVYTKTEQSMENPVNATNLYGLKTLYIVKKSLQWTVQELATPLVVTIFYYFCDMILMKMKNAKKVDKVTKNKLRRKKKGEIRETSWRSAGTVASRESRIDWEGYDERPLPSEVSNFMTTKIRAHLEELDIEENSIHGHCTIIAASLDGYLYYVADERKNKIWTRDEVIEKITSNNGSCMYRNQRKEPFPSDTKYGKLFTMLFCHETIALFYPYYSRSKILSIPADTLVSMRQTFCLSPSTFCFYGAYVSFITEMVEGKDKLITNLPELSQEKFEDICEFMDPKPEVSRTVKIAVEIYRILKERCVKNGHKFLVLWEIYVCLSQRTPETFAQAMKYLTDHKAVVSVPNPSVISVEGENEDGDEPKKAHDVSKFSKIPDSDNLVYLSITYMTERMLIEGLEKVFSNYRASPPILMENLVDDVNKENREEAPVLRSVRYDPRFEPPMPTTVKCSEHIMTVKVVAESPTCPVIAITGPGGSGKTTGLRHVEALFPPNSCVVVTAQGSNAAACREKVSINSMTIFMLLMMHTLTCPKSPYYDHNIETKVKEILSFQDEKEKDAYRDKLSEEEQMEFDNPMEFKGFRFGEGKCFVQHIETLILEEVSLADDERSAALIQVLTTCGNLKQVIFCGDHRQMLQISYGNFMSDITMGFPNISYRHCHRDRSGRLFMHARAIHERKYEDIRFDDEQYQMIEVEELKDYLSENTLREGLRDIVNKHDRINASVNTMIITRTNKMRRVISSLVREKAFGDSFHYHRGQKICLAVTDYSITPPFIRKQILVVWGVEDRALPENHRKCTMTREAAVATKTDVVAIYESTEMRAHNPQSTFRMLIAVPLGKCLDDPKHRICIPFFDAHKKIVSDASCVTINFAQGFETEHIVVVNPSGYKYDTNRGLFTGVTRGSKSVTFVSTHDILEKWCNNLDKERNSVMWVYLQRIVKDNVDTYLRPQHTERRRRLEREGETRDTYSPVFHLEHDPTDAQLNLPPSKMAERLAAKEGDRYDADAMVKRDEEMEAAIAKSVEEASAVMAKKAEELEAAIQRKIKRAEIRAERKKRNERENDDVIAPCGKKVKLQKDGD